MVESITGFIGVILGGFIAYFGERKLRKDREVRVHKAALLKIQFTLVQIMNDLELFKRNYNKIRNKPDREIYPPIFGTTQEWSLGREILFDIFLDNKIEKEIIIDCSFLDKEFRSLLGAIEDKIKYYDRYEVDKHKMRNEQIPEPEKKHLRDLTDSIYNRLDRIDIECLFKKIKTYIDCKYPGLSIDCSIKKD